MDFTTSGRMKEQAIALASGASPFGREWTNERFLAINPIELIKTRSFSDEEQEFLSARQALIAGFHFDKPSTYMQWYDLYVAVVGMNDAMREGFEEWTEEMESMEKDARWKLILAYRAGNAEKELEAARKEAEITKKQLEVARGVIKALQQEKNDTVEKASAHCGSTTKDEGTVASRAASDGAEKGAAENDN